MSRRHVWSDEIRTVADPRPTRLILWALVLLNLCVLGSDLLVFSGLLMLVSLTPIAALAWNVRGLRHNSRQLSRWRMARCRRHIEEMEIELGWRERPVNLRASAFPRFINPNYSYGPPMGGPGSGGLSLGKYIGIGR